MATIILLAACPTVVFAYLDPGSGSYFFQILIAGILGGAYAIKIYFKRLVEFINNLYSKKSK
jgi:hypothetical protein